MLKMAKQQCNNGNKGQNKNFKKKEILLDNICGNGLCKLGLISFGSKLNFESEYAFFLNYFRLSCWDATM